MKMTVNRWIILTVLTGVFLAFVPQAASAQTWGPGGTTGTSIQTGTLIERNGDVQSAANMWSSSCSNWMEGELGKDGFPDFKYVASGADHKIYVHSGMNTQNNLSCAMNNGNEMHLFEQAKDGANTINCDLPDSGAHEMWHVAAPGSSHTSTGIRQIWKPNGSGGVIGRSVEDTDCTNVDKAAGTPNYSPDGTPLPDPPVSPIVLDLGGRPGIWTTGLGNPVVFDIDGDSHREPITWIIAGETQGFLALDLDGNGRIEGGQELFGNATLLPGGERAEHGFAALSQYDARAQGGNRDGVITSHDRVWSDLVVWIDQNHDATTQPGELRTLTELKIIGLELDFVDSRKVDPAGNLHRFLGRFQRQILRGRRTVVSRELMVDIFFQLVPDRGR